MLLAIVHKGNDAQWITITLAATTVDIFFDFGQFIGSGDVVCLAGGHLFKVGQGMQTAGFGLAQVAGFSFSHPVQRSNSHTSRTAFFP